MNKIAIIGPYPPPYGGISVHIKRTLEHLTEGTYIFFNESTQARVGDESFRGKLRFVSALRLLFGRYRLIHHHSPNRYIRLLLCLMGFFHQRIYLHIHGASLKDTLSKKNIISFILKKTIRNVHILADNPDIAEFALKFIPRSITQIDAFLPPRYDDEIYNEISRSIILPNTKYRISMVGWFTKYNEQDLYGFDIALEALKILRDKKGIDISIVASVNGINDNNLYNTFLKRRKAYELEESFVLLMEDYEEIWPIYLMTDLFIRPTNTDGNALSIKEGLWFECPVIASDAVPRPVGSILFENRNVSDLVSKILERIEIAFVKTQDRIEKMSHKRFKNKLLTDIYEISE